MLLFGGCRGPATVVREAARAARRDDYAGYVACFTRRSRPLLRTLEEVAARVRPGLAHLGAGVVHVRSVRPIAAESGHHRVEVVVGEGGQTMPIVLQEHASAWRIDLIDTERTLTGLSTPF